MVYLLMVVGFVLLLLAGDWLVDGSTRLARRYQISEMVIGLTIVSMGTSMPELMVNLIAAWRGDAAIAIGNVIGSNIANILLILGVAACIAELPIPDSALVSEIPFSIAAAFMMGFLANAALFVDLPWKLVISQVDGLMLLLFFFLFMVYICRMSQEQETPESVEDLGPAGKAVGLATVGVIGLFIGGKWVVEGAVALAQMLGMSSSFIGLTIVAVGTSLPELVTSAVAAWHGRTEIAVGNVIGSNIFNILFILGLSALFRPLPFDVVSNADILMLILSSVLLLFALMVARKKALGRFSGVVFILVYAAYLVYLVQRG